MVDALVLSDLHLGSENCQADNLIHFLESIHYGERPTRRLILNGDLFDSFDFRRLKKRHWKVLSLIRKMSDVVAVTWINGNHDGPAEMVSHLLGVEVRDDFVLESGTQRILFLHGHQFDIFIEQYPLTTWAADCCYRLLQRLDRNHHVARLAKRSSKVFLRSVKQIEEQALLLARKRHCDVVCCGHTHLAAAVHRDGIAYFNSGCWTERPCHYLVVDRGVVTVNAYVEPVFEAEVKPMLAFAG
ncbi:UDP-2,3-diacylglucosamine diphosphatase [soil metagenome]